MEAANWPGVRPGATSRRAKTASASAATGGPQRVASAVPNAMQHATVPALWSTLATCIIASCCLPQGTHCMHGLASPPLASPSLSTQPHVHAASCLALGGHRQSAIE